VDESKPVLIISDTQMPYEALKALQFCEYVKNHYGVPDENVMHVGDEADNFHGGSYPKGGDYPHTPNQEINITREKFKEWASIFPKMKICISNHGMRWVRKASAAEMPSQVLAHYQQLMQTPPGWIWRREWIVNFKHPFKTSHGMELSGKTPYRLAAELGVISHAFGHLASSAGICQVVTREKKIWAMNTGCLIDTDAYAFKYGEDCRFKPTLGIGLVFNKGSTPFWLPYE
jgi:hypothetical protein